MMRRNVSRLFDGVSAESRFYFIVAGSRVLFVVLGVETVCSAYFYVVPSFVLSLFYYARSGLGQP